MKHYLLIIVLLSCFSIQLKAQQRPLFSQYLQNQYLLNPAVTGLENYIDARAGHRRQWSGLSSAPSTYYLTVHSPLKIGDYSQHLPAMGRDSALKEAKESSSNPNVRHGIGGSIITDKLGPLRINSFSISYAAHVRLDKKWWLSAGLSGGARQWVLDPNDLDLENPDEPALQSSMVNKLVSNLNFGFMLYSEKFFVGLASEQLLQNDVSFNTVAQTIGGKLATHYFANAGIKITMNHSVSLVPSARLRYVNASPATLDVNLKAVFLESFWLGGSYRNTETFTVFAGAEIDHKFVVAYAYDFSTGRINDVSNGSHEIVVGIRFGKAEVSPRKYLW